MGVAYPAIAESKLRAFEVGVPSLHEQTTVVRFLDHADRRIRRYIRAKEKLIALLEQQKQAIVHQAVTGRIDVEPAGPTRPTSPPATAGWLMYRLIGKYGNFVISSDLRAIATVPIYPCFQW